MSRYFFHVVGGEREFRDQNGRNFGTPQDATANAARIADELAQDGDHYWGFVVTVSDEDDNELARVTIKPKDNSTTCRAPPGQDCKTQADES